MAVRSPRAIRAIRTSSVTACVVLNSLLTTLVELGWRLVRLEKQDFRIIAIDAGTVSDREGSYRQETASQIQIQYHNTEALSGQEIPSGLYPLRLSEGSGRTPERETRSRPRQMTAAACRQSQISSAKQGQS